MSEAPRPRYGGSKTRTGCKTCKARHVKCDEGKPACQRCIKAGRQCEGYAPVPSRPRRPHGELRMIYYVPAPSREMSPNSELQWIEQRALSFFRERTAPELNGPFAGDLWTHSMLVLANYHPSVRHALIALGSAHEDFASRAASEHQVSEFSLQHYKKAVSSIVGMSRPQTQDAVEIVLASCIVFSLLEIMRGFVSTSISHITSGMRVIQEEEARRGLPHQGCISRDMLHQLFQRLDSQMSMIGEDHYLAGSSRSHLRPLALPDAFHRMEEAVYHFELLYDHVLRLLRRAGETLLNSNDQAADLELLEQEKNGLETIRQHWQQAFYSYMKRASVCGDPTISTYGAARLVLEINNATLQIMLNVNMVEPEQDWDNWIDTWRKIVDDAESYLILTSKLRPFEQSESHTHSPASATTSSTPSQPSSNTPNPRSLNIPTDSPESSSTNPSSSFLRNFSTSPTHTAVPVLSMSLGCVAPLYFTVARCRDPAIRHRGLALLQNCNRREGLWDSRLAAQVAGQLVSIEERAAFRDISTADLALASLIGSGAVLIKPEHRIKTVSMQFGQEGDAVALYSYRYPGRDDAGKVNVEGGHWDEKMEYKELTRWSLEAEELPLKDLRLGSDPS